MFNTEIVRLLIAKAEHFQLDLNDSFSADLNGSSCKIWSPFWLKLGIFAKYRVQLRNRVTGNKSGQVIGIAEWNLFLLRWNSSDCLNKPCRYFRKQLLKLKRNRLGPFLLNWPSCMIPRHVSSIRIRSPCPTNRCGIRFYGPTIGGNVKVVFNRLHKICCDRTRWYWRYKWNRYGFAKQKWRSRHLIIEITGDD